jgi:hypothetical protein
MPLKGTSPAIRVGGGGGGFSVEHGALVTRVAPATVASDHALGNFDTVVFDTDTYYEPATYPASDQLDIIGGFNPTGGPAGVYYVFGGWAFTFSGTPIVRSYVVSGTTYYYGDVTLLGFVGTGGSAFLQPMLSVLAAQDFPSNLWILTWEWLGYLGAGQVIQNPLNNNQSVSLTTATPGSYLGMIKVG